MGVVGQGDDAIALLALQIVDKLGGDTRRLALVELEMTEGRLGALVGALGKAVHADSDRSDLEQLYLTSLELIAIVSPNRPSSSRPSENVAAAKTWTRVGGWAILDDASRGQSPVNRVGHLVAQIPEASG